MNIVVTGLKYFKEIITAWYQKYKDKVNDEFQLQELDMFHRLNLSPHHISEALSYDLNNNNINIIYNNNPSQQSIHTMASIDKATTDIEFQEIENTLTDMIESSSIAVNILNELLLYEKIDGKIMTIEFQEVNTKELILNALHLFKVQVQAKEIRMLVDLEPVTYINVNADIHKFSQVIRNILSNALKFTPTGGIIYVFTELLIKDNNSNNWIPINDNNINNNNNQIEGNNNTNTTNTRFVELFDNISQYQNQVLTRKDSMNSEYSNVSRKTTGTAGTGMRESPRYNNIYNDNNSNLYRNNYRYKEECGSPTKMTSSGIDRQLFSPTTYIHHGSVLTPTAPINLYNNSIPYNNSSILYNTNTTNKSTTNSTSSSINTTPRSNDTNNNSISSSGNNSQHTPYSQTYNNSPVTHSPYITTTNNSNNNNNNSMVNVNNNNIGDNVILKPVLTSSTVVLPSNLTSISSPVVLPSNLTSSPVVLPSN